MPCRQQLKLLDAAANHAFSKDCQVCIVTIGDCLGLLVTGKSVAYAKLGSCSE